MGGNDISLQTELIQLQLNWCTEPSRLLCVSGVSFDQSPVKPALAFSQWCILNGR